MTSLTPGGTAGEYAPHSLARRAATASVYVCTSPWARGFLALTLFENSLLLRRVSLDHIFVLVCLCFCGDIRNFVLNDDLALDYDIAGLAVSATFVLAISVSVVLIMQVSHTRTHFFDC